MPVIPMILSDSPAVSNSTTERDRPARSGEPIFHQPWWLDAVAPGRWDAATVERGGRTLAAMPFVVRGPRRLRVLLERKLPAVVVFHQNFSTSFMNCLPFIWAGYRAEFRYTYQLRDLSSEQALWAGPAGSIRREIRKATQRLEVREVTDVERFYRVWATTFERQGVAAPDRRRLERIDAECAKRDARTILFAYDEVGQVHAVAYTVRDRRTTYYLMGGGDPHLRTSGAGSLLVWEAIRRASADSQVFDFEGSMLRPVERFFRAFGGRQTPYPHVSRATRVGGVALTIRANAKRWAR